MSILTAEGLQSGVRVFSTMGTVLSLTVRGPVREAGWADGPEQIFTAADHRFSLYRSDSELSLIAAGEAALAGSSAELRRMYAMALGWRTATGGDFTPHRPDGVVDLSGVVKSWAMAASGAWLHSEGYPDWCLNAGGDVLCSGTADDGEPWHVGIVDPQARQSLLSSIVASAARPAVATSGSAERGEHIWRRPGVRADFIQVTVRAADIITADVLATAIIAGGTRSLDHASSAWPVDILAVRQDGSLLATPGFARH
ncbi:FAD:protein FMN transferase [Arthrobacter sp. H14-L1]|uniref:FAD:protein FMN transferase n=1 Tax=Arthrobacter sp. H14-L1 TaxID=2996697 RepID=UPI00226D9EC5|nr:FAD:protein FMN transferase [Arthrobacter sp. H14-L1]MCY0905388.1 FAD:protein FMN transferase [Arthrobacter sp. H14-L1]